MANELLAIAKTPKHWLKRMRRRRRKRADWEDKWARDDFDPGWLGRGVSREIVAAVDEGWVKATGPVLDIGCGEGEVAAWFAERGNRSVGIDIAEAAVIRARKRWRNMESPPEFLPLDITAKRPPDLQYQLLVDRGCFHGLNQQDHNDYIRNLVSVSARDARMLLFMRAFRRDVPVGDETERRQCEERVRRAFGAQFSMEDVAVTYMDRDQGTNPDRVLPGLVFRLSRIV